jgi:hypothetical protein
MVANTIEAIKEKNGKQNGEKMRNWLFFIFFFCAVLCLSQIINCRLKKTRDRRQVCRKTGGKCVFSRTFIFFFTKKKDKRGPAPTKYIWIA